VSEWLTAGGGEPEGAPRPQIEEVTIHRPPFTMVEQESGAEGAYKRPLSCTTSGTVVLFPDLSFHSHYLTGENTESLSPNKY